MTVLGDLVQRYWGLSVVDVSATQKEPCTVRKLFVNWSGVTHQILRRSQSQPISTTRQKSLRIVGRENREWWSYRAVGLCGCSDVSVVVP